MAFPRVWNTGRSGPAPRRRSPSCAAVVAECGGLYATHTRNQAGEDQETIAEAIRTAQTAGVALQISHISVVARLAADGVRAVDGALEQVDRARRAGLDVDFDMHTRLFGTTNLSAALPPEVLEGGQAAVAARLRDPEVRRRVGTYRSIVAGLAQGDWQRILLSQYGPRPELAGQSLADIGRDMGLEPVDLICELLLAAQDRVHEPMILAFCYREDEVRRVFAPPALHGRLGRHGPVPRRSAAGGCLPRGLYLGGLVFPALCARYGSFVPGGGRPPSHRAAGRSPGSGRTGGRSARAPGPTWRCSTARPSANGARSPRPISLPGAWSTCWSTACPHSKTGRGPGRGAGRCCAGAGEGRWHLRF